MSSSKKSYLILLIGIPAITTLLIGYLFGYIISLKNVKEGNFEFSGGRTPHLKINIKKDFESVTTLVRKIFEDKDGRNEAVSLLENEYNMYNVLEPDFVSEITANLEPEHNVSQSLFELRRTGKGPFKDKYIKVKIGFPSLTAITDDSAAVLRASKFRDEKIELFDYRQSKSILLRARYRHNRVLPDVDR